MRFHGPDNSILDKSRGPQKFMLSDSTDKALGEQFILSDSKECNVFIT